MHTVTPRKAAQKLSIFAMISSIKKSGQKKPQEIEICSAKPMENKI